MKVPDLVLKTTDHNLYLQFSFLTWPFESLINRAKKNGKNANPKPQIDRFYRAMLDPKTPLSLRGAEERGISWLSVLAVYLAVYHRKIVFFHGFCCLEISWILGP